MKINLDIENYNFSLDWIKDLNQYCLLNKKIDINNKKLIESDYFIPLVLKIKMFPNEMIKNVYEIEDLNLIEKQIVYLPYKFVFETKGVDYIIKTKTIVDQYEITQYSMDYIKLYKDLRTVLKDNFKNYQRIYNKLIKQTNGK